MRRVVGFFLIEASHEDLVRLSSILAGLWATGLVLLMSFAVYAVHAVSFPEQSRVWHADAWLASLATIAHADTQHAKHFFVGDDQWSHGNNTQICARDSTCPTACEKDAVQQGRVRRALHTLSEEEWARVVRAMRVMTEISTADGVDVYGAAYRDYSFHVTWHVLSAYANDVVDDAYTDVTGGGPQQPAWHALQLLMFEDALLAVDPSIGGIPYVDWRAMDADAYDRYFGAADGTRIADFSAETAGWGSANRDLFVVDHGPFALWPVPRFEWHEWLAEQPDEVRALLSTADAWWDNYTAPLAWDAGLEQLRLPPPADAGEWGFFPYLLRGHIGDDFAGRVGSQEAWAAAVEYCTSTEIGLHNEMEACVEGRLVTQQTGGTAHTFDMHLKTHVAFGGDMQDTRASAYEPFFWFHHAGIDWVRRTWMHRNERLRPWAFGYPEVSGYTFTPTGLYDCLGCGAYGLGFDGEHLEELGRRRGNASAADVLCGGVDKLYTYDTLLAAKAATSPSSSLLSWMGVAVFSPLLGFGIGLAFRRCGRAAARLKAAARRDEPAVVSAVDVEMPEAFDMRTNHAAAAAAAVAPSAVEDGCTEVLF